VLRPEITPATQDELLDELARVYARAAVDRYLAETKTPGESSLSTGVIVSQFSSTNERRQHKHRAPPNATSA
jgi:hypothetical protein